MLCASIEVAVIVVLGFKHGDRKLEKIDILCQLGALFGLVLWFVFNSPAIAVITTIAIDLAGCIPTIRHSWTKPHGETWITFLLSGMGGGLTVLAAGNWKVTAVAYPLYLLLINLLMTERERMLTSIQTQIDRLERMDNQLYDDKLAGDITKEKYHDKHQQFIGQKAEFETQKAKLDENSKQSLEQRLVLLELSQKPPAYTRAKHPSKSGL